MSGRVPCSITITPVVTVSVASVRGSVCPDCAFCSSGVWASHLLPMLGVAGCIHSPYNLDVGVPICEEMYAWCWGTVIFQYPSLACLCISRLSLNSRCVLNARCSWLHWVINQVLLINSQNWYSDLLSGNSSLIWYVLCPSVPMRYHSAFLSMWGGSLLLVLGGRYTHSSMVGTFSWTDVLSDMQGLWVPLGVSEVMWHRNNRHKLVLVIVSEVRVRVLVFFDISDFSEYLCEFFYDSI